VGGSLEAERDYLKTWLTNRLAWMDNNIETIHAGETIPPTCDFDITASPSSETPSCSATVSLTAGCTGADCAAVSYQWTGNGINVSAKSVDINAPATNGYFIYTVTAAKTGCENKTATANIVISNCQTPAEPFSLCLEAENAVGNGTITEDPNASAKKTRGDKENYNHYVDYAVNGVKTAGTYQVKLRYYAHKPASVSIAVNESVDIPVFQLPATHSWNIVWREESMNVVLAEGSNTIRIQGLSGYSVRQDRLCVTNQEAANNARSGAAEIKAAETDKTMSLSVFPNPAQSEFFVKFNSMSATDYMITLIDMKGKVWYNQKVKGQGTIQERIRVTDAPSGIYLLQIKKAGQTETRKILIIP
jgi:hypothetical protein